MNVRNLIAYNWTELVDLDFPEAPEITQDFLEDLARQSSHVRYLGERISTERVATSEQIAYRMKQSIDTSALLAH